ncbi:hypothetical protein BU14_0334s0005 [Porphyra umbilicalis]|uniref:Uncharacterized protein n=1 Tax=Porphyra umbilicalis TaxID=2786 RepID=A0A1X6NYA1_PORUM|nr:hypothetical protein BU14_0334s0005 [Porphyra umbilicalis]|eukprot:OSX73604.1 hypothetical protein BU14_0334s0005 [Porphyra umbilicalis]
MRHVRDPSHRRRRQALEVGRRFGRHAHRRDRARLRALLTVLDRTPHRPPEEGARLQQRLGLGHEARHSCKAAVGLANTQVRRRPHRQHRHSRRRRLAHQVRRRPVLARQRRAHSSDRVRLELRGAHKAQQLAVVEVDRRVRLEGRRLGQHRVDGRLQDDVNLLQLRPAARGRLEHRHVGLEPPNGRVNPRLRALDGRLLHNWRRLWSRARGLSRRRRQQLDAGARNGRRHVVRKRAGLGRRRALDAGGRRHDGRLWRQRRTAAAHGQAGRGAGETDRRPPKGGRIGRQHGSGSRGGPDGPDRDGDKRRLHCG